MVVRGDGAAEATQHHLSEFRPWPRIAREALPQVPDSPPGRARLPPREHPFGVPGRIDRPVGFLDVVAGAAPVRRDLGGRRVAVAGGQHRSDAAVQRCPLGGEESASHGVLEQGVPQPVAVLMGGSARWASSSSRSPAATRAPVPTHTASSLSDSGRAATDSAAATSIPSALTDRTRSKQHLRHTRRHPRQVLLRGRDVAGGGHELLGEERAALSAAQHVGNERTPVR